MARKSLSKSLKQHTDKPITKEERTLLMMYRHVSRWERSWFFMIMQSLAWGSLIPKLADKMTWEQVSSDTGLPKARKAVRHG